MHLNESRKNKYVPLKNNFLNIWHKKKNNEAVTVAFTVIF